MESSDDEGRELSRLLNEARDYINTAFRKERYITLGGKKTSTVYPKEFFNAIGDAYKSYIKENVLKLLSDMEEYIDSLKTDEEADIFISNDVAQTRALIDTFVQVEINRIFALYHKNDKDENAEILRDIKEYFESAFLKLRNYIIQLTEAIRNIYKIQTSSSAFKKPRHESTTGYNIPGTTSATVVESYGGDNGIGNEVEIIEESDPFYSKTIAASAASAASASLSKSESTTTKKGSIKFEHFPPDIQFEISEILKAKSAFLATEMKELNKILETKNTRLKLEFYARLKNKSNRIIKRDGIIGAMNVVSNRDKEELAKIIRKNFDEEYQKLNDNGVNALRNEISEFKNKNQDYLTKLAGFLKKWFNGIEKHHPGYLTPLETVETITLKILSAANPDTLLQSIDKTIDKMEDEILKYSGSILRFDHFSAEAKPTIERARLKRCKFLKIKSLLVALKRDIMGNRDISLEDTIGYTFRHKQIKSMEISDDDCKKEMETLENERKRDCD